MTTDDLFVKALENYPLPRQKAKANLPKKCVAIEFLFSHTQTASGAPRGPGPSSYEGPL
jgi:hypothetical protein